jgi:hypothetical protein
VSEGRGFGWGGGGGGGKTIFHLLFLLYLISVFWFVIVLTTIGS